MRIIKSFSEAEIVYDNLVESSSRKNIVVEFGVIFTIDFHSIIDSQFQGGNLKPELFEILKAFMGLGQFSKAPCGGFANFYRFGKSNETEGYVVFSGVNEVSNSHYIVTVHNIIRLD